MKLTVVVLGIFLLTSIGSCCCKKSCSSNVAPIQFYNFDAADMDTILIKNYQKDMVTVADSHFTSGSPSSDSSYYVLYANIDDATSKVVIGIPGTGKVYTIDKFTFSKNVCNACFLGNDYYTTLSGCHINDSAAHVPISIIK